MSSDQRCPECGAAASGPRNPFPTVDVVVYDPARGIVLVRRANEPHGWALPGGFVDYGETCEHAARREAREETGLSVVLTGILGVYSDPSRDPRKHTMSVVYTAQAEDVSVIRGGDDASQACFFPLEGLPEPVVFDHPRIIKDFVAALKRHDP